MLSGRSHFFKWFDELLDVVLSLIADAAVPDTSRRVLSDYRRELSLIGTPQPTLAEPQISFSNSNLGACRWRAPRGWTDLKACHRQGLSDSPFRFRSQPSVVAVGTLRKKRIRASGRLGKVGMVRWLGSGSDF